MPQDLFYNRGQFFLLLNQRIPNLKRSKSRAEQYVFKLFFRILNNEIMVYNVPLLLVM